MNTVAAVRNTNVCVLFFSLPAVQVSYFFFVIPFSHLAGSKCCKLSLLVKICLCPSLVFLSPASSISTVPCCSGLSLHIFSCNPLTYLSHCLLPTPSPRLPPPLPFPGWLVDSFYCLLSAGIPSEEHSCCGRAMCGRTCCRGEPNAAKSHKRLSKLSLFVFVNIKGLSCIYTFDY